MTATPLLLPPLLSGLTPGYYLWVRRLLEGLYEGYGTLIAPAPSIDFSNY
jgi:hypothetical protein